MPESLKSYLPQFNTKSNLSNTFQLDVAESIAHASKCLVAISGARNKYKCWRKSKGPDKTKVDLADISPEEEEDDSDVLKAIFPDGTVYDCAGATVGDWRQWKTEIKEIQKKDD